MRDVPRVQLFEAFQLLHLIQLSPSSSIGLLALSLELQPLLGSLVSIFHNLFSSDATGTRGGRRRTPAVWCSLDALDEMSSATLSLMPGIVFWICEPRTEMSRSARLFLRVKLPY